MYVCMYVCNGPLSSWATLKCQHAGVKSEYISRAGGFHSNKLSQDIVTFTIMKK